MLRPVRVLAAVGAAGTLATACSGESSGGTVTVTVPPTASSATTSSTAPSPTVRATATALPGTCDSLLPDFTVGDALPDDVDLKPTDFVVTAADPDIGRLTGINCRYGVTGSGSDSTAAVEIGVSLYRTVQQAEARVTATSDDYTVHGAKADQVAVGDLTGTRLTGGAGEGYDLPVVVAASGQRTIAVSVDPDKVGDASPDKVVVRLATLAVRETAP